MESERDTRWMRFKLGAGVLGILAGSIVFFVFTFSIGNLHAGLWGLLSAILATIVFHQHLLYRNFRMERWHTPSSLTALRNLGILTSLGSLSASIYYFYTTFAEHQSIHPYKDSLMLAGVWSFMSLKWSVALIMASHQYKTRLDREYTLF